MNEMNILFINTDTIHSINSKEQNCVDWTEKLKEHLQLQPYKDTLMKKHTALKQNIKTKHCYTRPLYCVITVHGGPEIMRSLSASYVCLQEYLTAT